MGGKKVLPRFMGGPGERGVRCDIQAALLTGWMWNGRGGIGCWRAGMRGRRADKERGDEGVSIYEPRAVVFDTVHSKKCSSGRHMVFTIK